MGAERVRDKNRMFSCAFVIPPSGRYQISRELVNYSCTNRQNTYLGSNCLYNNRNPIPYSLYIARLIETVGILKDHSLAQVETGPTLALSIFRRKAESLHAERKKGRALLKKKGLNEATTYSVFNDSKHEK